MLVQMLGMCPTMAVTNVLANGIAMGVATTFVLVGSGLFVSLFRKYIAHEVRITSYILIIATFVTLADLLLAATFPEISKALGPFIPLIVANCLLLGRAEAFAAKVGPVHWYSVGFTLIVGFAFSNSATWLLNCWVASGVLPGDAPTVSSGPAAQNAGSGSSSVETNGKAATPRHRGEPQSDPGRWCCRRATD